MKLKEFLHVLAAIIILAAASCFFYVLRSNFSIIPLIILFSAIVVVVAVAAQKLIAYLLDAEAVHEIWTMSRFGYKPEHHLKTEAPVGVFLPLLLSLFSLGYFKFPSLLTYETKAKKYRAAKRFGYYSYTEMTEWHNALIGASGIFAVLALAVISYFSYFSNFEILAKLCAFYAFANMIPISKLNGTQIFFGSKILFITLSVITLIFFGYAILI